MLAIPNGIRSPRCRECEQMSDIGESVCVISAGERQSAAMANACPITHLKCQTSSSAVCPPHEDAELGGRRALAKTSFVGFGWSGSAEVHSMVSLVLFEHLRVEEEMCTSLRAYIPSVYIQPYASGLADLIAFVACAVDWMR